MKLRMKMSSSNFIMYLCLFDICILPVIHIAGIPFKVCFIICVMWIFCYLAKVSIKIGTTNIFSCKSGRQSVKHRYGRRLTFCLLLIIFMTIIGEMTLYLFTNVVSATDMRNQMFGYFLLIAFMGMGYAYYDYNKNFLVFILFLYCLINIVLSSLREKAPFFLKYIYGIIGEESEAEELSLRINGTLGNPNATLCLMNCIFMSIIVFYTKGLIKINSNIKLLLIMAVPILTNCFVNSRGEFIITFFLELVFAYEAIIKQRDGSKRREILIIFVVTLLAGIAFLFLVLIPRYPTVKYSIERIFTIFTQSEYDRLGATESITERPFIHANEFLDRFIVSPIWGTGIGAGAVDPFIRSSARYHNDWFGIFASSGIIGGASLLYMVYTAVKKCGIFYILPFIVTAISNGFVMSYYAIGIYFMTVMTIIRYEEMSKEEKNVQDAKCYI